VLFRGLLHRRQHHTAPRFMTKSRFSPGLYVLVGSLSLQLRRLTLLSSARAVREDVKGKGSIPSNCHRADLRSSAVLVQRWQRSVNFSLNGRNHGIAQILAGSEHEYREFGLRLVFALLGSLLEKYVSRYDYLRGTN
jgi:hypothetical protein